MPVCARKWNPARLTLAARAAVPTVMMRGPRGLLQLLVWLLYAALANMLVWFGMIGPREFWQCLGAAATRTALHDALK